MGFQEILFLKRFKLGIVSFTALLVFMCGGLLTQSMQLETLVDRAPSDPEPKSNQSFVVRQVAAVLPGVFEEEKVAEPTVMTVNLDCSDNSERPPIAVQAKHLKLRAENCEIKDIRNVNNGFQATLFQVGDRKYASDLISLAEGENEIQITTEFPKIISLRVLTR